MGRLSEHSFALAKHCRELLFVKVHWLALYSCSVARNTTISDESFTVGPLVQNKVSGEKEKDEKDEKKTVQHSHAVRTVAFIPRVLLLNGVALAVISEPLAS